MKLSEIIIANTSDQTFDVTGETRSSFSRFEKEGKHVLQLTKTLSIVQLGYFYGLMKNNSCVGWIELSDDKKIAGKFYKAIMFIFMSPEIRKTYAVGAFIIGLRKIIKTPLILGSDAYGGVLFSDGVKLVKALNQSAIADVKILDLKSGNTRDIEDADLENPASKGITLVFEDDDFPLMHLYSVGSIFILENCEKEII